MSSNKNIVLILTDQQRTDSLGAYGSSISKTTSLDSLAKRGVRFSSAFTPCAVCSPARASLFSGLYPHEHGVTQNGGLFRLDIPNLAKTLLKAGYRLGYAGKWHISTMYGPSYFGFEADDWLGYSYPAGGIYARFASKSCRHPVNHYLEYLSENKLGIPKLEETIYFPANKNFEIFGRQTGPIEASFEHYVSEEAIELINRFVNRSQDGKPFFLWINFWGPHVPYILPEPFFSMFTKHDVSLSPSMKENWKNKPWMQRMMSSHYWGVDSMDDDIWRETMAKYNGYCAFLDWEINRIIQKLNELGLIDDTYIAFSSDHGSMVGHHRLIDKGPYPYDDIQSIPLIIAGPNVKQDLIYDEFVYLHDLTPTILDLVGTKSFKCSNAQSLRPVLDGDTLANPRDEIFMVRHHHPFPYEQRWIRTKQFKYGFNASDIDELYDLDNDPEEMVNLINDPDYSDTKKNMIELMHKHILKLNDPIELQFKILSRT